MTSSLQNLVFMLEWMTLPSLLTPFIPRHCTFCVSFILSLLSAHCWFLELVHPSFRFSPSSHVFRKSPLPPSTHPSPTLQSHGGAVRLMQPHAELLQSQARTKNPLSQAGRHNVGLLWQHWRWSHAVAKQLIALALPPAALSVCACSWIPKRKLRENERLYVCMHGWESTEYSAWAHVACGWIKSFWERNRILHDTQICAQSLCKYHWGKTKPWENSSFSVWTWRCFDKL